MFHRSVALLTCSRLVFNITDHQEEDHILIWVLEALESRGFVKAESSQEQRLEQEHNPIPLESYRNGIHESPPSESNWSEVSDKLSSGVDPIPLENIVLLMDEHEANLSDGQHSLDHGIISKNEVHTDREPQVYEFSEPPPPSWKADEYERNAEVLKGQITSGQTRVADLQVRLDELVVPSKIMQVPSALPNLICNSLKCHKTCVNGCSVRAQDSEGNWYYEDLEDNRTIRKHACPASLFLQLEISLSLQSRLCQRRWIETSYRFGKEGICWGVAVSATRAQ